MTPLPSATIGTLTVSRLLLGSNPFSAFSHQGPDRDLEMRKYYTVERIKTTLREAEEAGITGVVARTDFHVIRTLQEHWDEGGSLKWIAQTCPEVGPPETCVGRAARAGASACYIHGGVMDHLVAKNDTGQIRRAIDMIRQSGLPAGIAGHSPRVFEWAEKNLECDFYACCYYNPSRRDEKPEHVSSLNEWFAAEDRKTMTDLIRSLSRPVIHYKIMAAGRNDPAEAFAFCGRAMRPYDLACVGVFTKEAPDMLAKNAELFRGHCTAPA